MPIRDGIAQYALISAFRDHRFRKIEEDELESLECAWVPFRLVVSHSICLEVWGLLIIPVHFSCLCMGHAIHSALSPAATWYECISCGRRCALATMGSDDIILVALIGIPLAGGYALADEQNIATD